MNHFHRLAMVAAAAIGLAACEDTYGHGPYAGDYVDGYYDDYYGPLYDGYWDGDAFFFRGGPHDGYRRDDGHHFGHHGGHGFHSFHMHAGHR